MGRETFESSESEGLSKFGLVFISKFALVRCNGTQVRFGAEAGGLPFLGLFCLSVPNSNGRLASEQSETSVPPFTENLKPHFVFWCLFDQ